MYGNIMLSILLNDIFYEVRNKQTKTNYEI